ncbi:MAG: hypothetical protein ACPL06_03535 [Candidatus Anstonellales archaeon]
MERYMLVLMLLGMSTGMVSAASVNFNEEVQVQAGDAISISGYDYMTFTILSSSGDTAKVKVDYNLDTKSKDYAIPYGVWVPNPALYSNPTPEGYTTMYRRTMYCATNKSRELDGNFQVIKIGDGWGYYNYICRPRYYEQCILDGSFDGWYWEGCEKKSDEHSESLATVDIPMNEEVIFYYIRNGIKTAVYLTVSPSGNEYNILFRPLYSSTAVSATAPSTSMQLYNLAVCDLKGVSVPLGYRYSSSYCDIDGYFKSQEQNGESCENDFECWSNACWNHKCADPYSVIKTTTATGSAAQTTQPYAPSKTQEPAPEGTVSPAGVKTPNETKEISHFEIIAKIFQ